MSPPRSFGVHAAGSSLAAVVDMVLRSLFLPLISLSFKKSGSSKLISVPRWSSRRNRWARFSPSSKSGGRNREDVRIFYV